MKDYINGMMFRYSIVELLTRKQSMNYHNCEKQMTSSAKNNLIDAKMKENLFFKIFS